MFVLHEPTFDGLLSAFAWCLRRKEVSPVFFADTDQPVLLPVQPVAAEPGIRALFQRHFGRRLGDAAGRAVLETVYTAYLSEQDGLSAHLYRYLYLALDMKRDPSALLQDRSVAAVVQAARRAGGLAHQYLGLLRFRLVHDQLYMAEFAPDCHVLPLILPHFTDRLSDQPFVICDRRRQLAAWYRPGRGCSLHLLLDPEQEIASAGALPALPGPSESGSRDEGSDFEQLWQLYLTRLAIPERRNRKLQIANMPKKYWRYLTENPLAAQIQDKQKGASGQKPGSALLTS